jgi:hypothetical protein
MTDPNAEREVERADGFMNSIAKGRPVAAILIVVAVVLIGGWLIGLLRG